MIQSEVGSPEATGARGRKARMLFALKEGLKVAPVA